MSNTSGAFVIGVLSGICIVLLAAKFCGIDVRQEAIKAGVAEWTIDRLTGEKQFRWITPTVKGGDAP